MGLQATSLRSRFAQAFSLVEIVLALGIISFAIVAIMGMFPVALKSAQESQRETRAALIAQEIYSNLGSTNGTNRLVNVGTNLVTVSLASSNTFSFAYDQTGSAVASTNSADALFGADVLVTPDVPFPGVSQVQTTVYTPPSAPTNSSGRSTYIFVSSFSRN